MASSAGGCDTTVVLLALVTAYVLSSTGKLLRASRRVELLLAHGE